MIKLTRYAKNPIIKPREDIWWEDHCVLNPGVIYDGKKIHMLYRAMGGDRISRFGYCYSVDGINFKGFKEYPVFESDPGEKYERMGCEDPRITKIGDKYFITYVSASVHPATYPREQFATSMLPWRVRVSMLSTQNFESFHRYGILLHGIDSKNPALFPEKIDDQYVLLHRIHPDIWISYSKDMINWYDQKVIVKPRKNCWDSVKVGAGSPPIKTKFGWLNFYHGVDKDSTYRLGILILDLKDPAKVIYRSKYPVLEPTEKYEKVGFEKHIDNVVFSCGAIEKDEKYYVYYGASDKYICLATINKEELLHDLSKEVS